MKTMREMAEEIAEKGTVRCPECREFPSRVEIVAYDLGLGGLRDFSIPSKCKCGWERDQSEPVVVPDS